MATYVTTRETPFDAPPARDPRTARRTSARSVEHPPNPPPHDVPDRVAGRSSCSTISAAGLSTRLLPGHLPGGRPDGCFRDKLADEIEVLDLGECRRRAAPVRESARPPRAGTAWVRGACRRDGTSSAATRIHGVLRESTSSPPPPARGGSPKRHSPRARAARPIRYETGAASVQGARTGESSSMRPNEVVRLTRLEERALRALPRTRVHWDGRERNGSTSLAPLAANTTGRWSRLAPAADGRGFPPDALELAGQMGRPPPWTRDANVAQTQQSPRVTTALRTRSATAAA
jgi:hypothetical protein